MDSSKYDYRLKAKIIFDYLSALFRRMPLAFILVPYVIGIVVQGKIYLPAVLIRIILVGVTVLLLFFRKKDVFFWLLSLFLVFAGMMRTDQKSMEMSPEEILQDTVIIKGKILALEERQRGSRIILDQCLLLSPRQLPIKGKIQIYLPHGIDSLRQGMQIATRGILGFPGTARNPGDFDYRKYLYQKGIFYSLYPLKKAGIRIIEAEDFSFLSIGVKIREKISSVIERSVRGEGGGILKALILGSREGISEEVKQNFVDSGVIHVLAVSGLHVGYVTLVFLFIFGLLRVPKGYREWLVLLGLLFYSWLVDFRPSVVRASLMAGFILSAAPLQRKSNIYNSLAGAALIILIFDPFQLRQIGFQLSFIAVFSIVYIYRRFEQFLPEKIKPSNVKPVFLRWSWQLFLVSLAAQIGTLPLTLYYFHRIPIVSLIMNLFIIPLVSVIGGLGFALVILGLAIPFIAIIYGEVEFVLLFILEKLVSLGAHLPFAYIQTQELGAITILGLVILLILILHSDIPGIRKILLFFLLIVGNIVIWQAVFGSPELKITFLDVGQGDCAVLEFTNGKTMIVDTGEKTFYKDAGKRVIVPFLRNRGIDRIEYMVLTHPHSDHIGGTPYILRNIPVDTLFLPECKSRSALYREMMQLIDSTGTVRITAVRGMLRSIDGAMVFFLHPDTFRNVRKSFNDFSIVLKILYGNSAFLLTGDLEKKFESYLNGFGEFLRSDVLKVGHHGSNTSSSLEFLDFIQPQFAVISVGRRNKFGHPSEETLQRFENLGAKIMRTDINGAIIMETTGKKMKVKQMIIQD